MSDDLVKRICQEWIDDGRADDCFWEGWPECPTPEDSLTPRMVLDRIEELEAKLAKVVTELRKLGEAAKANAYGSYHIICHGCSDTHHAVDAIIAKLTGGKDG